MTLKATLIVFFTCSLQQAWCQFGDPLAKWNGVMEDEKRSELAKEIIFNYKYEPEERTDSVLQVLYTAQNDAQQNINDWNHYIHSEIEKAQNNFPFALAHLDTVITSTKSDLLLIKAYSLKARIHTIINELGEAIDYFKLALAKAKVLNYYTVQSEIYAFMGEFYRKTSDFDMGLIYLDSAQQLVDQHNIYGEVNIDILDRKAAIYSQTEEFSKSVNFSRQALSLAIDQQNLHAQAVSHNELGYYYEHEPNYDSAHFHYNQAIDIWKDIKGYRYLANVQFNKARLFTRNGKLTEAEQLLFETEELCLGKNWKEVFPRLYEYITMVYHEKGDSVNYYKYKNKTTQAYFDLFVIENEKKIVQMEFEHEHGKKILRINELEDDLETKNAQLDAAKQDRDFYLTFFIASLMLLFTSLLFIIRLRKRSKN